MIWRVESPVHLLTLTGHLQGLSDLSWSPDGAYLCTASDDQTLRAFDCTTGQVVRVFRGHQSYVYCCAYSPRGNVIASGSYDETINLWDIRTAHRIRSFGSHSDPVTALDFTYDGTILASGSYDGLCRVWDATSCTCIRTLLVDNNPYVFVASSLPPLYTLFHVFVMLCLLRCRSSVKFTPNGEYVLAGYMDSTLRLWNYERSKCLKEYKGHVAKQYSAAATFFCSNKDKTSSSSRNYVVSGSEDGSLCMWDLNSKTLVQNKQAHSAPVLGVDCHPNKNIIATGAMSPDNTIKLWTAQESSATS